MNMKALFVRTKKASCSTDFSNCRASENTFQKPSILRRPALSAQRIFYVWRGNDGHIRITSDGAYESTSLPMPLSVLAMLLKPGYALEIIPATEKGALPIMRFVPVRTAQNQSAKINESLMRRAPPAPTMKRKTPSIYVALQIA